MTNNTIRVITDIINDVPGADNQLELLTLDELDALSTKLKVIDYIRQDREIELND